MSIKLYYAPGACSFAPHVVLRETGAQFTLTRVCPAAGENFSAEYAQINPKARVPALMDGDFILTENPAVLCHIGRKFSRGVLYPASLNEEARCQELLAWSSSSVHVSFAQVLRSQRFASGIDGSASVRATGYWRFMGHLIEIDRLLRGQPYALGDSYSVVDPLWLVFYRWGVRLRYPMRTCEAYTDFVSRVTARPAVAQALSAEGISIYDDPPILKYASSRGSGDRECAEINPGHLTQ
jgi:glutathione S-transferase